MSTPVQQSPSANQELPLAKRTKVAVACRNCRDRKVRCDGDRPACHGCVKRGLAASCTYEPVSRMSITNQSPVSVPRATPTAANQITYSQSPAISGHEGRARDRWTDSEVLREVESIFDVTSSRNTGTELNQVDALATVSPNNDNEEPQQLYGGSSTIAFVRSIAQSNDRPADHMNTPQSISNHRVSHEKSRRQHVVRQRQQSEVYPRRSAADDFMHCYWEFSYPLFPVVHRPSIVHNYEKIWSPYTTGTQENHHEDNNDTFPALVNLIFALGCQYSKLVSPQNRRSMAEEFYERSRQSFDMDNLDSPSISHVQVLLLTGIYLQSTSHASRCWNFIGLAIRVAQSLGLHLETRGKLVECQLDNEMRKRIWYICIHLDRLSTMTFGRPVMIHNKIQISPPSMIDDEYLNRFGFGFQPANIHSRLGLFIYSSQLFNILGDVLSKFYADEHLTQNDLDSQLRSHVSEALKFGRRLDDFYESVPIYLRISTNEATRQNSIINCVQLQQQVLYCRFSYTKVLSLRPVVLLATQRDRNPDNSRPATSPRHTLDDGLVAHCANMCLTTCFKLIQCLHDNLLTAYRVSGWHTVYFTFASAVVLLAGLDCSVIDPSNLGAKYDTAWTQCCDILQHYEEQIPSAARALEMLYTLRAQINSRHGSTQSRNRGSASGATSKDADAIPTGNENSDQVQPKETNDLEVLRQSNGGLDFTSFNPAGTYSISDAWFGQQIADLNWLDFELVDSN